MSKAPAAPIRDDSLEKGVVLNGKDKTSNEVEEAGGGGYKGFWFNNNKTSVAQLMSDLFGVFIGIGITASSDQMRGHHHRATVIFLGTGIMIVHVLGISAGLKDWRLLNTGGKFLTFRCFNLLASLGLSIYFWVLDGWHWHSTSLRLPSYILSVLNQILYLVLFSILIGQFCIYKKRNSLNPTKNTKQGLFVIKVVAFSIFNSKFLFQHPRTPPPPHQQLQKRTSMRMVMCSSKVIFKHVERSGRSVNQDYYINLLPFYSIISFSDYFNYDIYFQSC